MADTHDAGDPPIPAWLIELGWQDRYQVQDMVARGGMGRVYEALHRELGLRAALKIIDPGLMNDERALARFETEALTLRRLQEPTPHPNIVRVLDFKITQGVGCLAMVFVPGPDLKTWCERQDLDMRDRARLLLKVARAAGYMHSHGVVHRDLKPSNILVHEQTQEPVIVDFGIVKPEGEWTLTLTQEAIGTANYMAPEQLRTDRREVGPRADVYALGVVLYEFLSGGLPYPGSLAEVTRAHAQEKPPRRRSHLKKELPRDLEVICLKALSLRSAERYANGTELAEDLDRWLRGDAILARPLPLRLQVWRQARLHPALMTTLSVCVVLAGVGALHYWASSQEADLAERRQRLSEALTQPSWTVPELQAAEKEMVRLPAAESPAYHFKLLNAVIHQVRESLEDARLPEEHVQELQALIDWCAARDEERARTLTALLSDRRARWETLLHLEPPFERLEAAFFPGHVRVEGQGLYPVPQAGREALDRVFLKVQVPRRFEVKGSFLPAGELFRCFGFCIRSPQARHYLRVYGRNAARELPQAAGVEGRDRADFIGLLCLMREEGLLAATPIFGSEPLTGPLTLTARLDGNLLSGEMVGGVRVEHRDLYMATGACDLGLDWPPRIQLTSLSLNAQSLPRQPTPLERGDALAVKGQWLEAEGAYAALIGDPEHGAEAAYKLGECQAAQKRLPEALTTWESLLSRNVQPWSPLACFQLWQHHATSGRLELARPFLDQLSASGPGAAAMLRDMRAEQKHRIASVYRQQSASLRVMQVNPEVETAIRAHQLLGYPALDIAQSFGFARHFNGTDETARLLFQQALRGVGLARLSKVDRRQALLCLDMTCWLDRPEETPWLDHLIRRWQDGLDAQDPEQGFLKIEEARTHARQGRTRQVLEITTALRTDPHSQPRLKISACLLEAALLMDDPAAVTARLQEARTALNLRRRTAPSPVILDGAMLGCAAQAWTPELMADILVRLLTGPDEAALQGGVQSQFARLFLKDEALVTALNHLTQGPQGQALFRDYCLRARPVRELAQEAMERVLARYLQECLFTAPVPPTMKAQLRHCAGQVVRSFCQGGFSETDLIQLITGLRSGERTRLLQFAEAHWDPALQQSLHGLFQQSTAAKAP